MIQVIQDLSIAVGLLALMIVSLDAGFRTGRRAGETEDHASGQVGAIQGAVLGLLGLLLAFSFAAAGSRFVERQDLIAQEANAIGTAWLRADLLDEPQRSELRAALEAYTAQRVRAASQLQYGWNSTVLAEVERLHARIWQAARDGVATRPELALALLTPVNETFDVHALRVSAALKHLPYFVTGLLVVCSLLAVNVIGYGCGIDGRRRWLQTVSLALLISAALWITIDLDHPRKGVLRLDDAPLQALKFEPR